MSEEAKWYVAHTYSGYEEKVKTDLEKTVKNRNLQDMILEVKYPTEEVVEIREDGKRKVTKRKTYPGYVMVKMFMNDKTWYVVRNTPGVTGFVGSATKPIPLEPKEVEKILKTQGIESEPKTHISVEVGEEVRITEGPFENCMAVVTEVNEEKGTVKGLVNMFGRETPVEVDYSQIEKGLE